MNLVLSHPSFCKPTGETAQVFRGRREESPWRIAQRRLFYDFPLRVLVGGKNLFDTRDYTPRKTITAPAQKFIDLVLYQEKKWALAVEQNQLKSEEEKYETVEVAQARLLSKNINGVVLMTEVFNNMYPEATFLGLLRDGRALCESHTRRGASAQDVARLYCTVGDAMHQYAQDLPNFHLVRFEDIIADPLREIKEIYRAVGVSMNDVSKFRLQVKTKTGSEGERKLNANQDRQVVWYEPEFLDSFFDPKVNEHQINQLAQSDREMFERSSYETLGKLGYKLES